MSLFVHIPVWLCTFPVRTCPSVDGLSSISPLSWMISPASWHILQLKDARHYTTLVQNIRSTTSDRHLAPILLVPPLVPDDDFCCSVDSVSLSNIDLQPYLPVPSSAPSVILHTLPSSSQTLSTRVKVLFHYTVTITIWPLWIYTGIYK